MGDGQMASKEALTFGSKKLTIAADEQLKRRRMQSYSARYSPRAIRSLNNP
jgi:hypothetical protein